MSNSSALQSIRNLIAFECSRSSRNDGYIGTTEGLIHLEDTEAERALAYGIPIGLASNFSDYHGSRKGEYNYTLLSSMDELADRRRQRMYEYRPSISPYLQDPRQMYGYLKQIAELEQDLQEQQTQASETSVAPYSFKAEIAHPDYPNFPHTDGHSIPFPTTPEVIAVVLENLRIRNHDDVTILSMHSDSDRDDNLSYWLNKALQDFGAPQSLEELNSLVTKICNLPDDQHEIFAAVLQAKWHSDTLEDMIRLAENTDCFYLQPAYSAKQYGEHLIAVDQDEFHSHFDKLLNSKNQDDIAFAMYIGRLEKCVDKGAYGHLFAKVEGGVFTDYGYLIQDSEMRGIDYGTPDIPAEHHISAEKDAPVLKVSCLNGQLAVGDLVLAAPYTGVSCLTDVELPSSNEETFALLVGTVTELRQVTQAGESEPTSSVIVDFTTPEYSEKRRIEVTSRLGDYYGRPLAPGAWPPFDVECAEMSASRLARVTDFRPADLKLIIENERVAEGHYRFMKMAQEQKAATTPEKPATKVKVKPSLKEVLRLGREKSREQFGAPTQEHNKGKGDPTL